MLCVKEVIVVEGKHDAVKLQSAVEGIVFETNGFRIFHDEKRLALLRSLAAARGVVLLTDSDGAGFVIRRYLTGALPNIEIKQAYIPEILGKERRKSAPSKEGLLGVEGMQAQVLTNALLAAGVTVGDAPVHPRAGITKARLYADGLVGGADSAAKRARFLAYCGLPQKMSANRLLQWINAALTEAEYAAAVEECVCEQ